MVEPANSILRSEVSRAWRAELRATARLALPLSAANLLQMVVYAVDVLFVARLGSESLAAIALAVAILSTSVWSSSALVSAVAPLATNALGRSKHSVREVRRSIRMGLWMSVIAGLAVMGICFAGEPIMLATGQQPHIAHLAGSYLAIISWSAIPVIVANVLRIFASTLDRAVIATWVTVLVLVVNGLANWALIFGHLGMPALGLDGAAYASVLASLAAIAAYVAIIQSDRRMRRYHLFGRLWRPDWVRLQDVARIGLPIAAMTLAEASLFSSAAFLMGALGKLELAAHTLALQLAALCFQVPFGIAQAATIRAGLHNGARDRQGVGRAGTAALALTASSAALFAGGMLFTPHLLLSIYIASDTPENAAILALATNYLAVAAAFQLFDGSQTVLAGLLRGLADTRTPFLVALCGYWGAGFTTAIVLGFFTPLEGVGVWVGLATGLVVTAAILLVRWRLRDRLIAG